MGNASQQQTRNLGKVMIYFMWILVFAILIWFFGILETNKLNPNQNVETKIIKGDKKEVVLQSSVHGHYLVTGKINNEKVTFLVDTGASYVSVPEKVSKKLGLDRGVPLLVNTANGTVTVYATILNSISIGDIVLRNIKADINPHMQGDKILLGMSFLRHLSVKHEDNKLTIQQ